MRTRLFLLIMALIITAGPVVPLFAQNNGYTEVARVKYRGGGDWYNDPSSLSNLISFTKDYAPVAITTRYKDVALGSTELHDYPFLFLTGHGTITANNAEVRNLRTYLENGGFLYVDDDYGLDPHIRSLLKRAFPDEELLELPAEHPIYNQLFNFPRGLPKIHEHDNKPPQGYGLFLDGKLVVYYTYESNLADGWADPEIHNDPAEVRERALRMGANILVYALSRY